VRLVLVLLLGFAYAVTTVIVGLAITVAGVLRCNEGCEHETNWTADVNSWQWTVVFALGPITLLAGLVALVLVFAMERVVVALTAVGVHAVALVAAAILLLQSPELARSDAIWVPITIGCGLGLVYARRASRQRAGARRE
jgi:hypothetical protein